MASRHIPRIPSPGNGGGGPPPQIQDHFAPKYIVGNVPAGDPAVNQGAPFIYIFDPGDGSGIASALAQAAVVPGDVYIRPGTYDFNTGAVVTPLTVPIGTRVTGAGDMMTFIIGRSTGNQGIFDLQTFTSLRDMRIVTNASDAGSVVSTAMILNSVGDSDGIVLEHLEIGLATDVAGVLRTAIDLGPTPKFKPVEILDIRVIAANTTGALSPTTLININATVVAGRDVVLTGGDISLKSTDGTWVCEQFFAVNWMLFGILQVSTGGGGGSLRISEFQIAASVTSVGGICVRGAQANYSLRHGAFQQNGSAGSMCVWLSDPGKSVNSPTIEDCFVIAGEYGLRLGDAAQLSSVNNAQIFCNDVIECTRFGIIQEAAGQADASECHYRSNIVTMNYDGVIVPIGMELFGNQHVISDNTVNVFANPGIGIGIEVFAQKCTITGNSVNFLGQFGLHILGERCSIANTQVECSATVVGGACIQFSGVRSQVTGGTFTQGQVPYVGPAILCAANQAAVTGTTVFVSAGVGPTPGIAVSSNNTNITGNVVEGSGGVAVTDTGVGNNVNNNIAA